MLLISPPKWRGLFPGSESRRELSGVFVNAYADESGKVVSPTMVVCGYVAPWSVWSDFQDVWDALLRKHKIPYLHMSELMRWEGLYAELESAWGDSGRDEVILEFAASIDARLGHPFVRGVGVGIQPKDWNSLPMKERRKLGNIELFLFEHFISFLLFRIRGMVDEDYRIGLTFDYRSDGARLFSILSQTKGAIPEANARIASFCLATDEIHIGLQAADMLNYYCREGFSGFLADPTAVGPPIYSLLTARTNFKGLNFNKTLLSQLADAHPISHLDFMASKYGHEQALVIVPR